MATTTMPHSPTPNPSPPRCLFLDALPPELRLNVYSHLVVSPLPVHGKSSRQSPSQSHIQHPSSATRLHLSILQANRQIHAEAKAVFLSRNEFCISSTSNIEPSNAELGKGNVNSSFLEHISPSFSHQDLPFLRRLTIDPVFRSEEVGLAAEEAREQGLRESAEAQAAAYSTLLTPA
jgi:hypothetical protein